MKQKIFGYKVCYKEKDSNKTKMYLVTNRYDGAKWDVDYYSTHPPNDRKDNHLISDATWFVVPVTSIREHKRLWKGCPF